MTPFEVLVFMALSFLPLDREHTLNVAYTTTSTSADVKTAKLRYLSTAKYALTLYNDGIPLKQLFAGASEALSWAKSAYIVSAHVSFGPHGVRNKPGVMTKIHYLTHYKVFIEFSRLDGSRRSTIKLGDTNLKAKSTLVVLQNQYRVHGFEVVFRSLPPKKITYSYIVNPATGSAQTNTMNHKTAQRILSKREMFKHHIIWRNKGVRNAVRRQLI